MSNYLGGALDIAKFLSVPGSDSHTIMDILLESTVAITWFSSDF